MVTERSDRTAHGYRRFRCRACGKQFNERTNTMLNQAQCSEADLKQLEQEIGDMVTAAVRFADESPFPDPASLHADVMVED